LTLSKRGFDPDKVLDWYTIEQVMLFVKEAARLRREELLQAAFAVRVGMNADKKEWQKFVKEMSSRDETKEVDFKDLRRILDGRKRRGSRTPGSKTGS
jgi:Ca2+-binding EF-hand superfamily protein